MSVSIDGTDEIGATDVILEFVGRLCNLGAVCPTNGAKALPTRDSAAISAHPAVVSIHIVSPMSNDVPNDPISTVDGSNQYVRPNSRKINKDR